MVKNFWFQIVILLILTSFRPSGSAQTDDPVLARINSQEIHLSQLADRVQEFMKTNGRSAGHFPSGGEVNQMLQNLVEEALVEQKAAEYQFEDDNNVQQRINSQVWKETIQQYQTSVMPKSLSVTNDEIEAYYKVKQDVEFKNTEAVRIRMIFVRIGDDRKTASNEAPGKKEHEIALAKCRELYRRLKEGQDFGKLATTFSEHNSSKDGGEMGYVERGVLPPKIEGAVFAAKVGLISEPLESSYGYHIVEVLDHRQEHTLEMTPTLRESIRKTLTDSRETTYMGNLLDSLKKISIIEYNYPVLSKLNKGRLGYEDWLLIVNGDSLSYTELLAHYDTNPLYNSINLDSSSAMRCLHNLADTLVFLAAADKMNLDQSGPVLQAKDAAQKNLARQQIMARKLKLSYNPDLPEITKYYQDHKEKWKADRPISVQHIIFSDSAQAGRVRKEIMDGLDFSEAARQYYPGDEEIRETVSNLGFIAPGEMPEAFYQAADRLDLGEISQPVSTEYGWHLIKLLSRQDYKSMEEVNYLIRQELINQHEDEGGEKSWQQWISEGEEVWIDQDLLNGYLRANQ